MTETLFVISLGEPMDNWFDSISNIGCINSINHISVGLVQGQGSRTKEFIAGQIERTVET